MVTSVTDAEILEAKRRIDPAGLGCEPASAAALAGVRKLVGTGAIRAGEQVVCVLTGHLLKDAEAALGDAPPARVVEPGLASLRRALA